MDNTILSINLIGKLENLLFSLAQKSEVIMSSLYAKNTMFMCLNFIV